MSENTRPMICDCGSTRISTKMNVGCDIDPSGEEEQHLDTCLDCLKTRLWGYRWNFLKDNLEGPSCFFEKKWSKGQYGVDFS